jgi:3-deoxy-manno-octulosonate cytidylyltransferase (CMP-KDO synthetase)
VSASIKTKKESFVACVIPMRLASTRLENKMLAQVGDQSVSQRCVGRALEIFKEEKRVKVIVAVDSLLLKEHILKRYPDVDVQITNPEIPSGTDRVFQAFCQFSKEKNISDSIFAGIINLQGDVPFVAREGLQRVASYFLEGKSEQLLAHPIVTLAQNFSTASSSDSNFEDASAVKVICDRNGRALYFSRFPIPYSKVPFQARDHVNPEAKLHVGVYGYTPQMLAQFCAHAPVPLELLEGLEQLRALWMGADILVFQSECEAGESYRGIDTIKDLEWAKNFAK